jgi:hypothetical protein
MKLPELHVSRPVYEGLPWIYMVCGLLALAASYRYRGSPLSAIVGVLGIAAVIAGIVVLLRRRDYRELRSHYENPDSPLDS